MSDITAPAYRTIPIIPALKPGAMEGKGPFVASEKINEAIGFPGQLVEDWHDRVIAKMGDMLSKYRSLKVFMDACVHCGACYWNCAQPLPGNAERMNIAFRAGTGGLHSAEN